MLPAIYFWQAKFFRLYAEQTGKSLLLCAMEFVRLKGWNKVKAYAKEHPNIDFSKIVREAAKRPSTEQAQKDAADYIAARALHCLRERYHWIEADVMRTRFFSSQTYSHLFYMDKDYLRIDLIISRFEREAHLRHNL